MTDDKRLCQPAGDLSLKRRGKISERSFAYIIAGHTMAAKFARPYRCEGEELGGQRQPGQAISAKTMN